MFYKSVELASLLLVILTCVSAKEIPKEKPTSLESLLEEIEHLEKDVESLKDSKSQSKCHFKGFYIFPRILKNGKCWHWYREILETTCYGPYWDVSEIHSKSSQWHHAVNCISTWPCTIDQIKKLASNKATFQLCFKIYYTFSSFSFSGREA